MLEGVQLAVGKIKHISFTTHPPNNISGSQVDLGDLAQVAARKEQVAIIRHGKRIAMYQVDIFGGQIRCGIGK